jgi:uncharacterized OB-fold protein
MSRFKAPVKLEYTVTAGRTLSRFLAALIEGRIVGMRCPSCKKVYVPPRGSCPACGVGLGEDVPVKDTGTLCTFCIVNVPFEGQTMKLPYVYAAVLLDGADIPILHLVDAPAAETRMGMRVKAQWAPPEERKASLESIRCFTPTGEPDAPPAAYKEHV